MKAGKQTHRLHLHLYLQNPYKTTLTKDDPNKLKPKPPENQKRHGTRLVDAKTKDMKVKEGKDVKKEVDVKKEEKEKDAKKKPEAGKRSKEGAALSSLSLSLRVYKS